MCHIIKLKISVEPTGKILSNFKKPCWALMNCDDHLYSSLTAYIPFFITILITVIRATVS